MTEFINITPENLENEHLCCIIRSRVKHPGVEAKRQWLADRLKQGHVFRKLNVRGTVFIEYAPLDAAWVPIVGDNYIYIYCLWVTGEFAHHGYARQLMEYCIADARARGKSGICMLGAHKQKAWLSNQSFAKKFGFEVVDTTDYGYQLLALSFDGTKPQFTQIAKKGICKNTELTIYYDIQCPFVLERIQAIKNYCTTNGIPLNLYQIDSLSAAKDLPCVFNNWAVFYQGRFITVNILAPENIEKILAK